MPASLANRMRRAAVDALLASMTEGREKTHRAEVSESIPFPEATLDYRANVANCSARAFYEQHGARVLAPAFEIVPVEKADLMTCRHCIRATLELCPKMLKAFPALLETHDRALFKPNDLILTDSAGDKFRAIFHCKRTPCEMTLEAF